MRANFTIKYSGATPKVIRKEMTAILTTSYGDTGKKWHEEYRGKHFTREGAEEYGYAKRKGENLPRGTAAFARSYVGKKLKSRGHTLPLVYSGQSELLSRILDVRANGTGSRVIIHARALRFKNPKSRVNMAKDMTAMSPMEHAALVQHFTATMDTEFSKRKEQTTKSTK